MGLITLLELEAMYHHLLNAKEQNIAIDISTLPRYAQIWYENWDLFLNPCSKVLPKEYELAWGLWCIKRRIFVFMPKYHIYTDGFTIEHDRCVPLLKKVASSIESIPIEKISRLFRDGSHKIPYMSLFFEKIIFHQKREFTMHIESVPKIRRSYLLTLLDYVSKPVSLHPENAEYLFQTVHPNLNTEWTEENKVNYFNRVSPEYLCEYTNDTFWIWFYENSPDISYFSLKLLNKVPRKSIGGKAQYLMWDKDSVIKYRHLFKKEMYPVLDFYLTNHFLFGDNIAGKVIIEGYQMNQGKVGNEIDLMI